jgi:hypothetical protein
MIYLEFGDYFGRFDLGTPHDVPGILSLEAGKVPVAHLYLDEVLTKGRDGTVSLPAAHHFPRVVARLASRHDVLFDRPLVEEQFPKQVFVAAPWVLIGVDAAEAGDQWDSVEIYSPGIDAVLGNAVASTTFPDGTTESRSFSVELTNPVFESEQDDVAVVCQYYMSANVFDPYQFGVRNFGQIRLRSISTMNARNWITNWIDPLLSLLSVATGQREQATRIIFACGRKDGDKSSPNPIEAQLFRSSLSQTDEPAARRFRPSGALVESIFLLSHAPPLATMLAEWRSLRGEAAVQLFNIARDRELPASVRFLLCMQALESLNTSQNAEKETVEDAQYADRRTVALSQLAGVPSEQVDPTTRKFIKTNVPKKPARSLADRIKSMIEVCGVAEDRQGAWKQSTQELVKILSKLGYPATTLHDRLASLRNVISHGRVHIAQHRIEPAAQVADALLRAEFVRCLRFDQSQIEFALAQMNS